MRSRHGFVLAGALLVAAAGCGGSADGTSAGGSNAAGSGGASAHPAKPDGRKPEEVVQVFLEGLRMGNQKTVESMLTDKARASGVVNCDERSVDAQYTIGKVQLHGDAIAYVDSTWTRDDGSGEPETEEVIWALRREPQGWRVAGTIMKIGQLDGRMVPLDFEKPEEMHANMQAVAAEIQRLHDQSSTAAESVYSADRTDLSGSEGPSRR